VVQCGSFRRYRATTCCRVWSLDDDDDDNDNDDHWLSWSAMHDILMFFIYGLTLEIGRVHGWWYILYV
jgi:hypothetical protein